MPSTSTWIEVHTDLLKKTKTRRFAADIDRPVIYAAVHLVALWLHTADVQPDGDLSEYSDEDLADAAEFDGDPCVFGRALRQRRWLDPDGHLHNWWEYFGKYLERRERERRRIAQWRKTKRDSGQAELFEQDETQSDSGDAVTRNNGTGNALRNGLHNALQGGLYAVTGPDRTGTNLTGDTTYLYNVENEDAVTRNTEAKPHLVSDDDDESGDAVTRTDDAKPEPPKAKARREAAERLCDYYKDRIQPRSRTRPVPMIVRRLKSFSEDELRQGIDNFAADRWHMEHCARYGIEWFFKTDSQVNKWLLLQPEGQKSAIVPSSGRESGNGEMAVANGRLREAGQQLGVRDLRARTLAASTVTVESKPAGTEAANPPVGVAADDSGAAF